MLRVLSCVWEEDHFIRIEINFVSFKTKDIENTSCHYGPNASML